MTSSPQQDRLRAVRAHLLRAAVAGATIVRAKIVRANVVLALVVVVWGVGGVAWGQTSVNGREADGREARRGGAVGVGAQVGRPGGVAVKWYRPTRVAYDLVVTSDADDFVIGYVHRVWERPLPGSPLHGFVGPGVVGGVNRDGGPARCVLGVGGVAGLNFYAERFEVFLQVTPRIRFLPTTEEVVGGSVGLRYYVR